MAKRQWVYRPTDEEHELLLRAMEAAPEYPSISQFVREAVMRLIFHDDKRKLFTEVGDLIEDLHKIRKDTLYLILKNVEE